MSRRATSPNTASEGRAVRYLLAFLIGVGLWGDVHASQIPPMYQLVSQEQKVPAKLFFAIVLNESRTRTEHATRTLPWPWTINHRGKAHFFKTREAAFRFADNLVKAGDYHFDVGLGQMNWRWHRKRFRSLWDAFDPYLNLTAAAQHLREQFERPECSSWELAIGCYHRPAQRPRDKQIANAYRERVIRLWANI